MKLKNLTGLVVATAVLGLLSTGNFVAGEKGEAKSKTVKCMGVNECKGHGACGAADGSHDCSGKNECKGKGWVKVKSEEQCEEKGGKVMKKMKKD
jgi:hypothetical protein